MTSYLWVLGVGAYLTGCGYVIWNGYRNTLKKGPGFLAALILTSLAWPVFLRDEGKGDL